MSDGDKEHRLKLVQAWSEVKLKIATFALIGNGALLGVATAFLREIGPNTFDTLPLWLGGIGVFFGGFAIKVVVGYTDRFFEGQLDGEAEAPLPSKKLTEFLFRPTAHPSTVALTNRVSSACVLLSALCFFGSVAYLCGVVTGRQEFISEHPGSERVLPKW